MNKHRGLWRGKRVDNGEWVEGADVMHNTCRGELCLASVGKDWVSVDPATFGECTCGTDKTGKLAFEGDLLKDEFDVAIGVIRYGEYSQPFNADKFTKHIGFYVDWIDGDDKDLLRVDLGYWLPLVKIIGNIHDNPELLREGAADGLHRKENKL